MNKTMCFPIVFYVPVWFKTNLIFFILAPLVISSCGNNDFVPKPKGYFRIDLPKKSYQKYRGDCPFFFEFHRAAYVQKDPQFINEPCWLNIVYPQQNATIYLSYKKIEKDSSLKQLENYIEDSRSFVYKHTVKASDIMEDRILDDSAKVYGLLYSLEGNTASSMQFYITDSANHFLRGALYFSVVTNTDSLSPVIRYIRDDIHHFIASFGWKYPVRTP